MEQFSIEPGLLERLSHAYGSRVPKVIDSLGSMGPRYYFRINTLTCNGEALVQEMASGLGSVWTDELVEDAAWLPVMERHVEFQENLVEADKFATEAVLQGANLYEGELDDATGSTPGPEQA